MQISILTLGLCILVTVCIPGIQADVLIPTLAELQTAALDNVIACQKEHSELSSSTVTRLILTERIESLEITDDMKCFMECLIDKSDFVENGALHHGKFIATMIAFGQQEEKMRLLFDNCKNFYSDKADCDPLWNLYLCFHGQITYVGD